MGTNILAQCSKSLGSGKFDTKLVPKIFWTAISCHGGQRNG